MKKNMKVLIGIVFCIILLWLIIFFIDYNRCLNFKMPVFVIKENSTDLSISSEQYSGLGYKVQVQRDLSSNRLLKIEMYMFNKVIAGAIADIENSEEYNKNNDNDNDNNSSFRAIVEEASLERLIVTPIDLEKRNLLSDKVEINLGRNNDLLYFEGSELLISYTGEIRESYPVGIDVTNIQTEKQYKTKIEDIPQDYDLISAIQDNCVVNIHNRTIYNKDELDRFINNVNNNVPDFIRCIRYTEEGDMIISDVDFEGSGSFRYVLDSTRDEWAGKEDRKYYYARFKRMEVSNLDDLVLLELKEPIEGKIEEISVIGYSKNTVIVNNYNFKYLLDVKVSENKNVTKITENILKDKFSYDIYYYGIDSCDINLLNTKLDLIEALKEDKITMEQIIEQAEKDGEAGIVPNDTYQDGGSKIYFYNDYTIIKKHTENGNEDVYIGIPEMRLNNF